MSEQPTDPRNPGPGETGTGTAQSRAVPGLGLAARLRQAAGTGRRYEGLGDDAVIVAAGRWHAVEAWVFAEKLGAVRETIRRRPAPAPGPQPQAQDPGGLPQAWRKDLAEEIALELAITQVAADKLITLAWTLEVRLPLTAAALDAGILDAAKARLIADETAVLSSEDAGKAEALIAEKWTGKTWSQIRAMITRAVVNVDPAGAERRREQAEREQARIRFWREHAGTAAIAGYGLPTDEALKAMANVQNRARAYKRWGIPGTMDILRVMAFLDLLNGTDRRTRYPKQTKPAGGCSSGHDTQQTGQDATDGTADGRQDAMADGCRYDPDDAADDAIRDDPDDMPGASEDEGPDDGGGRGDGPGGGPDGNSPDRGTGPGGGAACDEGLAANVDLTIPLSDLLDRAQRAGEAHGLGVLDPGLARRLAAEAARNPRSSIRIVITGQDGRAVGFGRAIRGRGRRPGTGKPPGPANPGSGTSPEGTAMAAFTLAGDGPCDGYGTWTLDIAEQIFSVRLHPIPDGDKCDHRYQSARYQPSGTLRRLVEIRDGQCAMPICVRHPRGCDWEHAVPWPQGRTCACNGGYHCRHDHHIKQAQGWRVEQLPDGRRTWTTPAGLTYTSQRREYPT